jgi:hypothetical protein
VKSLKSADISKGIFKIDVSEFESAELLAKRFCSRASRWRIWKNGFRCQGTKKMRIDLLEPMLVLA